MTKAVVIGGGGFIGSHTADALSNEGYEVTIFDRENSPWISGNQTMVKGDILDSKQLEEVLHGSDYVYHFAGIADIQESKEKPIETIELNVMGTAKILETIVKTNVKRFIFASTMYVYSPYGSFYRATKQSSESIIEVYSKEFGVDYSFLRYGSVFGPRAQSWNGLRGYVEQIFKSGKLDYHGTGKEVREYLHVKDAAKLSVDILKDKYRNKAITVTGHQALHSEEMIDLLFEIAGKENKVVYHQSEISPDHYVNTPYRFSPKPAIKLVPEEFYDLGQGVLEVMEEVAEDMKLNDS